MFAGGVGGRAGMAIFLAGGLALAALGQADDAARPAGADPLVGRRIAPFVLSDSGGKAVGLGDFNDRKFLVVVFLGTGCPISNLYLPELNDIHTTLQEAGVSVIGINANSGDSPEEIEKHRQEFGIKFPVLCDPRQEVAVQLGAERTAEVFVLDPHRVVRYHGRVDDRFQYTTRKETAERRDLWRALEELRDGKPVSVASTPVQGCKFAHAAREKQNPSAPPVTYAKEVSRILQKRCQECHHPGTAAPFSLLTYEDAVNWSAMIREVVVDRRMPPWHADPRFGKFHNDRRLSADEVETLLAWIDGGTPRGNDADLPPEVKYADGWRIGEPDLVIEMPREYNVKATGTVPYQYFMSDPGFEEDVWVTAAEALPGNRAAVHHIIVFYVPPERNRLFNRDRDNERNWLVAYAPGDSPLVFPEGVGRMIPKGSKLMWQVHYTPTGKPEKDRSRIGLRLAKTPPQRNARVHGIANQRFQIAPGAAHQAVTSEYRIPAEVSIYSLMPHMHLRGKAFEYAVVRANGAREVLLFVPQYDFNWQTSYHLAEPLRLSRGDRLQCTAWYDNSSSNPANPDPTQTVRWGDQTWDEMMIGYVNYVLESEGG